MMMMEVSATSLLVILGIFCSAALAQPSPELQAWQCMRSTAEECLGPLAMQYQGMNPQQILNQIKTTDLAQTCGPVLTASQCVMNKISECGIDQLDHPRAVSVVKQARVINIVVNYVCSDRVEVFNEHKACLLNPIESGNLPHILQQCPSPSAGPTRPFCIPQGLPECLANIAQQACGEEIANELRSLGQQVLAEAGCPARELFKMMKKEMYSPMELIEKAFPSFF